MTDPDRIKHLEFVQTVIARHASNSFLIKGWTVTIAAALLGFAIDKQRPALAAVAIGVVAVFYLLDAYYLRQERLFRCLWDALTTGPVETRPPVFSMRTDAYRDNDYPGWEKVLRSRPLIAVYAALAAASACVALVAGQSDSDCRTAAATSASAAPSATASSGQNVPMGSSCQRGKT